MKLPRCMHWTAFVLPGAAVCFVSLIACSFVTTFVVINESNERIQVRYVLKQRSDPLPPVPFETPSVKTVSELNDPHDAWRPLTDSRYTFNAETRTVVVTLLPREALRVERTGLVSCGEDKPRYPEQFTIEEISITGSNGSMRLVGEQARRSFVSGDKTCDLVYR